MQKIGITQFVSGINQRYLNTKFTVRVIGYFEENNLSINLV